MRIAIVCALVVMLAVAATTEAAFCHTSAYKLDCATVEAQKQQIWAKCTGETPGGVSAQGGFETKGECCTIVQQTKDQAGWKDISGCEKSMDNAELYAPLKAAPCEEYKKDEEC